jgi:hypothetical protein
MKSRSVGKRPLGRTTHRCGENIMMNIQNRTGELRLDTSGSG